MVIANVAVVDPAGTVTDVGTLATAVVPLVNVTTTASVAMPDKVIVPVLQTQHRFPCLSRYCGPAKRNPIVERHTSGPVAQARLFSIAK